MDTPVPDPLSPYAAAEAAISVLTAVPPDVLRQLADGVLRIVNDEKPGVGRAAAQLRARDAVVTMLRALANHSEGTASGNGAAP